MFLPAPWAAAAGTRQGFPCPAAARPVPALLTDGKLTCRRFPCHTQAGRTPRGPGTPATRQKQGPVDSESPIWSLSTVRAGQPPGARGPVPRLSVALWDSPVSVTGPGRARGGPSGRHCWWGLLVSEPAGAKGVDRWVGSLAPQLPWENRNFRGGRTMPGLSQVAPEQGCVLGAAVDGPSWGQENHERLLAWVGLRPQLHGFLPASPRMTFP